MEKLKTAGIQRFSLTWPPSANTYWRNQPGGRVLISKRGRQYRRIIGNELLAAGYRSMNAARIGILILAHPPDRRRRDLDNLNKALLDALEAARLFNNDGQIDDLQLIRGEVEPGGRIDIQVWAHEAGKV